MTKLADGKQEAGYYTAVWDADGCGAGVYLIRLTDGEGRTEVKKVVLMK